MSAVSVCLIGLETGCNAKRKYAVAIAFKPVVIVM